MAITYPLITVSTRAQVAANSSSNGKSGGGWIKGLSKIMQDEGPLGFYRGLSSALFGITITNGVYYYWYEVAKTLFEKQGRNTSMSTLESMAAGAMAGSATAVVTNPIWVINTRMTANRESLEDSLPSSSKDTPPKRRRGTLGTLQSILKHEGPQALFQGVVPALILVINPIIQYTAFEQLKARLLKIKPSLGSLDFFILGALSKLVATSITYPYIVIKSRMQLRQGTDQRTRYTSVMDGLRKIMQHEGVNGLYKGISSKLLQSVLTAAILFSAKEEFYNYAVWALVFAKLRKPAQVTGAAGKA